MRFHTLLLAVSAGVATVYGANTVTATITVTVDCQLSTPLLSSSSASLSKNVPAPPFVTLSSAGSSRTVDISLFSSAATNGSLNSPVSSSISSPAPSASASACPTGTCCKYYQVVSGDTCFSIASNENVAESNIERWNPNSCGPSLAIGAELCISGPANGRAPPYGSFPNPSNGTSVIGSGTASGTGSWPVSTSTSWCAANTCCKYYDVVAGDSCSSIATNKGIPESLIEQWNPGMCGVDLQISAELCISGPFNGSAPAFGSTSSSNATGTSTASSPIATTCAAGTCCKYYKVVSGDSCDSIASVQNILEAKVEQWNPGQCGDDLQIGVQLCIDGPAVGSAPPFDSCASSTCCKYQTVESGDTCSAIAMQKGIPESDLETWNPGMCGIDLQVGANLCVEGSAAALGYTASSGISSPTASSSGNSTTGSPSPAKVTNSSNAGRTIQPGWSVESLLASVIMGMAVLF